MKTILDLIHAPMKRIAANSGGEYAGTCPYCGGVDRFRVWPEHPSGAKGGRFMCRRCGATGDGIAFLIDTEGMRYPEACRALGLDVPRRDSRLSRLSRQARPRAWEPKAAAMPSAKWSEAAGNFLGITIEALDRCEDGQAYAASRGILPATTAALALGWNRWDTYQTRAVWGLPEEVSEKTGKPRKVWLPAGLVIPSFDAAGRVWSLKIRRSGWTPEDGLPKYVAVPGGSQAPFIPLPGQGKPVVVAESELDAILCAQEAGSLVAAVALRSAGNKPDAATLAVLKSAPLILVSLDRDEAGAKGAAWWLANFRQAKRWPVVSGCKDVGDLAKRPGLIRAWIQAGLGVRDDQR